MQKGRQGGRTALKTENRNRNRNSIAYTTKVSMLRQEHQHQHQHEDSVISVDPVHFASSATDGTSMANLISEYVSIYASSNIGIPRYLAASLFCHVQVQSRNRRDRQSLNTKSCEKL